VSWIKTMVHRPALVLVIYLIILIFGTFSYSKLPVDMLPDLSAPVLTIVTTYPGASALDVENKLSQPMEDSLGSLSDLKELFSSSKENVSIVTLVFTSKADIDVASSDVRQNLERIKNTFPQEASSPQVLKFDFGQMPIITFAVTTEGQDIRVLKDELETKLFEPIRRATGVGSVLLRNAPDTILRVDIHQQKLLASGLTMTEVASLISANNLNVPAGDITIDDMTLSLRMKGEIESVEGLKSLTLLQSPIGGGMVTLGDIADIRMDLADSNELVLVNGEQAIIGLLRKTSDANTITVTNEVLKVFEEAKTNLPAGTNIQIMEDGASYIKGTISNLQQTVLMGGILVSLIVFVFLRRLGPTFIVAVSIPLSMIVTFLVIYSLGYTLNSVTLIAMSLSVGMVVDNGVVALENISRKIDEGHSKLDAAYEGAKEVSGALLASTTTTLVIFAPMIFISGIVGQMFAQLAVVMIVTISASLFVALSITPMLAGRLVNSTKSEVVEFDEDGLVLTKTTWWENKYKDILSFSLKRPWFTLLGATGIGIVTIVLLSLLGTDFLPKDDVGQLAFTIELPVGSTMENTLTIGEMYANELRKQPEVETVSLIVGSSGGASLGKEGSNIAKIRARLTSPKIRVRSDQEIGDHILEQIDTPPEVLNLEISRDGSGAGALGATKPIVVEFLGTDLDDLQTAIQMTIRELNNIPGVVNISADLLQTKPELQVNVDRNKSTQMGIPVGQSGQEMRMALNGATISRFSDNGKPRDMFLRFRLEDRQDPQAWKRVPVRTKRGQLTTLNALASQDEGEAPLQIQRKNKARMLTVSMELSDRSLGEVAADVEDMLSSLSLPKGIDYQIGGAIKDQRESFGDMGLLLAMGITLVYLVMVAQFESWTTPFVIMFSVPFAATGAFLALLLTGTTLSVTSFLGLIILIGVVVNNAIVLIDYVALIQSKGIPLIKSVLYAGQRRLRPVLITTMTTAGGMLPLALTKGEGEQLWGPMGKTALGGLLVSSVVTLVLVPTMYVILAKWKIRWAEYRKKKAA
jgi:hydrophobic/amphiphilic exporter-1 (mainly G- bacteria), HAE1 family